MTKKLRKGNILELIVDAENPKEMAELIKLIRKLSKIRSHKLMITTELGFEMFHVKLGKAGADSTLFQMTLPAEFGSDDEMYNMMGKMILDAYIKDTYYIKSESEKQIYKVEGDK